MIAGIELDLKKAWQHRRESTITASLALGVPLVFGSVAALAMKMSDGWVGPNAMTWQFVVGIGMACAVTALPILILLMAIASTMLTVPVVYPKLQRMKSLVLKH